MRRLPLPAWIGILLSVPSLAAAAGPFVPSPNGEHGPIAVSIEPGFIRPESGSRIRLRATAPEVEIRIADTRAEGPPQTAEILLENVFRERTDLPPGLDLEDVPEGVRFTVTQGPGGEETLRFRRRPSPGGVRFGIVGDTKGAYHMFERHLAALRAEDPDFLVILGDFVNEKPFEYDSFAKQLQAVRIPVFPVLGNHDRIISEADPRNEFRRRYGPTYRSFEYEGIGFWFVDSANDSLGAWQEAWLRESLESSATAPKVAFMHVPPFNILDGPFDPSHAMLAGNAQRFFDLIRTAGVDHVFAGHINGYARHDYEGISLTLTSGGGENEYENEYPLHSLLVTVKGDEVVEEVLPQAPSTKKERAAAERDIRDRAYIRSHVPQIIWGFLSFLVLAGLIVWLGRKNRSAGPLDSPKGWRWGVWLPVAFCVAIIVVRLAAPKDFYGDGQSLRGICVENIVFHNRWLLQQEAGAPAAEPPLYNWLAAVPCLISGRPWDQLIRLPSALAAVGLVILVYFMGLDWGGRRTGTLAAVIVVASYSFARLAGMAHPGMLLAFFIAAALWVFWRRAVLGNTGPRWAWFYIWIALAALTGGAAGILTSGLAAAGYLLWSRDRKTANEMRWGLGLLLVLGAFLLWLVPAVLSAAGDDSTGTLLGDTWNRVLGAGARAGDAKPFYYNIFIVLGWFAPWGILAGTIGLKTLSRRKEILTPERRFAWAWLLAGIGILLLHAGRADSVFPAYPAVALLVGHWIAGPPGRFPVLAEKRILQAFAAGTAVLAVGFIFLLVLSPSLPSLEALLDGIDLPPKTEPLPDLLPWAIFLALSAAAAGILLLKRPLPAGTVCLAASMAVSLWGYYFLFCPPAVSDANEEIEEFCEDIRCEINDLPLLYYNRTHHAIRFYLLRDGAPAPEEEIVSRLASGRPFCLMASVESETDSLPREWLERLELVREVGFATESGREQYRLYRSLPPDGATLLPLPSLPGGKSHDRFAGPP